MHPVRRNFKVCLNAELAGIIEGLASIDIADTGRVFPSAQRVALIQEEGVNFIVP